MNIIVLFHFIINVVYFAVFILSTVYKGIIMSTFTRVVLSVYVEPIIPYVMYIHIYWIITMQTNITDLKGDGTEGVGWGEIIRDLGFLKMR